MNFYKMIEEDELIYINSFNDKITLSKVIELFEKHNIYFTKTMIQNYVRVGVMPPPTQKRYYTKKHIVLLFLINMLKTVYSLDEIKSVFMPILREPETFEDDMLDVSYIYLVYIKLYKIHIEHTMTKLKKDFSEQIDSINANQKDKEQINIFLNRLNIMSLSVLSKDMLRLDLDKHNT